MLPLNGDSNEERNTDRVVYNDRLGYALVYYRPIKNCPEDNSTIYGKCGHRRREVRNKTENPLDEEFREEIARMVRQKERQTASEEIKKICAKVYDLFAKVERADLDSREILNYRVKSQIKGRSADEICDILVTDVLKHTKYVYEPRDTDPHKMKLKILSASIKASNEWRDVKTSRKYEPEREELTPGVIGRVEKMLERSTQAEVHFSKYSRALNQIQDDIKFLKRRCTDKIERNY